MEPVFLKVAFDRSPSHIINAVDSRSKHLGSPFIQIKKSISVGLASAEMETLPTLPLKLLKPVVSLLTLVKGSLVCFKPQVSWALDAKGIRKKRVSQLFISHYCSLKIITARQ